MKPSMLAKLDQLANRLVELDELLALESATSNMDNYRKMIDTLTNVRGAIKVFVEIAPL